MIAISAWSFELASARTGRENMGESVEILRLFSEDVVNPSKKRRMSRPDS
jgi:hypothetical protein